MGSSQRVLIVGAGIGGLSMAIALRRRGIQADVIERAPGLSTEGAGLYLIGITTRALRELGVGDEVERAGRRIRTQQVFTHKGSLLSTIDVDAFWSRCGLCMGMPRADLQQILAARVPDMPIRFGVGLQTLQEHHTHVRVTCTDGSQADYDLVIGADGIHSSVRRAAFGGAAPVYRGQMAWRFIAPAPNGVTGWSLFMGKGCNFLYVPIAKDRAYCYADSQTAASDEDPAEGRLERLRALLPDFAAPVRETLASMSTKDPIHYGPIQEVVEPVTARGRVVLIGDAAHAMSPNMAAGAALALEDALVLADVAASTRDPRDIAAAFASRRSQRVTWVRSQTHRRDKLRTLAPLARNLSMRLLWPRLYVANYSPLLPPP